MPRRVDRYMGYDIAESSFMAEDGSGRVYNALIIPGLKERPDGPVLLTREEAREFIRAEMAARESSGGWESFGAALKVRGRSSLGLTVPADTARALGLDVGDEVEVRIRRKAGPAESPPSD